MGADYFTDPLGGLTDAEWDGMADGRFYSSAFWLRLVALEAGAVSGGLHVALPGGGRAAVPVAATEPDGMSNPHLRWHDVLTQRGLPSPSAGGVLVAQRRGYLAHLLATPGVDRVDAAGALLEAVRSLPDPVGPSGSKAGPARVAMYLTTADVLALRAAGVRSMPVALTADAWLGIPPGGWEEWLETMGSSHRRRRVRSEVRKFEQAGYRVEHRVLRDAYTHVGRLAARTEQRYGIEGNPDAYVEAFRKHAELAGDRAEVLLCSLGDETPVGCCLYVRDGDTVYLRAVGFDYERLRGAAEYFNLAYYLPARMPGVRWLHAGIATPGGKALRGAELRPLWLLDLTSGSPLEGRENDVRAHNAAFLDRLTAESPAVTKALLEDEWKSFC
ncbi:GNAT family N-acetyltransferase [Streptomyces sp. CB03238]|uniref:GNAT family N-acetyltransferase n=1 Tax=Streptomyces sp. CB03238 TaxID=1907777 RepID=UPI000A0FDAB7|nr:GNAT family N-acetyltransferase [Streptomyces sp. CB03238]ORT57375.1 GNAT family N-acetyltransferase [Streptomyces sp. CB03238]